MKKILSYLTLFTSFSTLLCCAIPSLLVALGLGTTMVSALNIFPQITLISEHKTLIFSVAGIMLAINLFLALRSKEESCPLDKDLAKACNTSKKFSNYILGFSIIIYFIGAFFAYIINKI